MNSSPDSAKDGKYYFLLSWALKGVSDYNIYLTAGAEAVPGDRDWAICQSGFYVPYNMADIVTVQAYHLLL